MNKKHAFFRHIGLVVVLVMAFTPFILVSAQDVPREKTLIIGFEGGPAQAPENAGLNATATNSQGVHQVMIESLYVLNYQTGESVPWLASGPEKWNADFTQVDIPLREGVTWNDGEPFTADDVVFSMNMYKAHPTLIFAGAIAAEVKEASAVDAHTARLTLNAPNPRFIYDNFSVRIWGGVRIVPEHIWKDQDPETFTNFDLAKGWPVWTGPYKMIKATPTEFDFDRDPNWWGAKTGFQSLPAPERVIFVDGGPEDRKAAALADNEVDGEPSLRIDLFADVQSRNPDIIGWTKDAPNAWIDPCPAELGFNTEVAPWNDPDMRWAISYALPKQKIADATSGGFGQLSHYNFPDYPAIQSWLTENQDLLDKYDSTAYDPDKAKALIESKGYVMGDDGFYAKDGAHLSVDVLVKSSDTIMTPIIISSLQDVGIDAAPRSLVDASYFQARNVGDFQIETTHVNCGSVTEPFAELYTLHSKWIRPAGELRSNNVWGFSNPDYDKIVDQIAQLPPNDPQEHVLFRQALEIRLRELPLISLSQQKRIVPYSTKYWTNWPTAENGYVHPPNWWQTFIIPLVNIKAAGSS
jgi:peptide/nickel transport system substrate-binding protein